MKLAFKRLRLANGRPHRLRDAIDQSLAIPDDVEATHGIVFYGQRSDPSAAPAPRISPPTERICQLLRLSGSGVRQAFLLA